MVLIAKSKTGDFIKLVQRQFASLDFDAEHPLWLYLISKYKLDREQALWLSFLYMAYYDEASAWVTFWKSKPFTVPAKVDYPIGMNRRNLFGGKILRHLESLKQERAVAKDWPTHNFTGDLQSDWHALKDNIGAVWGNGRFAVYTTAEMLQKVNQIPVLIDGFDNKSSSGPADGVHRIYGCPRHAIPALDYYSEIAFQQVLLTRHVPSYTKVDRGVVESVLCNFSGVCRGKFYSGRNVDRQQQRIIKVEKQVQTELAPLWDARVQVMRRVDLGEYNGWVGIDKVRLKHYQKTGELLWANEKR